MHIYFSGIGGVGIGPLAMLAQDAGHEVCGSDKTPGDMIEELKDRNISVAIVTNAENIQKVHENHPIDLFVHTAALTQDHPEMVFVRENDVRAVKRDELINQIIREKNLKIIAISGTHGKTTSTGMAVWAFKQLGLPVSYSIGTQISFGPPAAYEEGSEYFVYEADEFDRNMLKYNPQISLITTIDYDHPDTYPSRGDYQEAFKQFAAQSKQTFIWSEDENKIDDTANVIILNEPEAQQHGLALVGEHNRENAFMVAKGIEATHTIDFPQIVNALNSFPGTKRRFEKIAENLYSDYAHHPVEIEKTLQLASELSQNITIVYQPHQNVRQNEIVNSGGYGAVFTGAQKVYWLPTYLSREDNNLKVYTPEDLIATMTNPEIAQPIEHFDEMKPIIDDALSDGNLVVAMGAGDFDGWLRQNYK